MVVCGKCTKKKKKKYNMFLFLYVFGGLARYDEEVGEIISEMEKKYEQPNENSSRLCGSNFYKVIGLGGILRREGNEMRRRLFEAFKEGLGRLDFNFFVCEDFGSFKD